MEVENEHPLESLSRRTTPAGYISSVMHATTLSFGPQTWMSATVFMHSVIVQSCLARTTLSTVAMKSISPSQTVFIGLNVLFGLLRQLWDTSLLG